MKKKSLKFIGLEITLPDLLRKFVELSIEYNFQRMFDNKKWKKHNFYKIFKKDEKVLKIQ